MNLYDYAELLMTTDKVQCFKEMFIDDKCCAMGLLCLEKLNDTQCTQKLIRTSYAFNLATGLRISKMNDVYRWSFPRLGEYLLCCLLPG